MNITSYILRHTAIPILLRRDNRSEALEHLKFLRQSQYWRRQKLLDYQWEKLKSLLEYAYNNVPYYQKVFDERSLTPKSFSNFNDLSKLPILTRDIIRDNRERMISGQYSKTQLHEFGTGGTTRRLMKLYRDHNSDMIKIGALWRFEEYAGRHLADRICHFWPYHLDFNPDESARTKFKNRYLMRELAFFAGSPSEETLENFYRQVVSFKPAYFKAFPNALYPFVKFVQANNYHIPKLEAIITTGETLEPYHKKIFTDVFKAPVFNLYASREVGNTACECENHDGLHLAMETSVVEIVKDGRPVPDGEEGEIIVTDLTNYGFPLIRYAIEDFGYKIPSSCSCGRNLDLMSPGVGRVMDVYIAPDGSRHSALSLSAYISEKGPPMGQLQYIQKSLTHFHIKVTNDPPVTEEIKKHIQDVIHRLVSPDIKVTIESIDQLPREKSGKIRYFICEIKEELK